MAFMRSGWQGPSSAGTGLIEGLTRWEYSSCDASGPPSSPPPLAALLPRPVGSGPPCRLRPSCFLPPEPRELPSESPALSRLDGQPHSY